MGGRCSSWSPLLPSSSSCRTSPASRSRGLLISIPKSASSPGPWRLLGALGPRSLGYPCSKNGSTCNTCRDWALPSTWRGCSPPVSSAARSPSFSSTAIIFKHPGRAPTLTSPSRQMRKRQSSITTHSCLPSCAFISRSSSEKFLARALEAAGVRIPLYVSCLVGGIILGNVMLRIAPKLDRPGSDQCLTLIAYVSLGLFYTMTWMSMQLWTAGDFLVFVVVVIIVQVLLTVCYIYLIVFRAMGRDYEAAVISAGFAGIVLGSTATTMAIMTAPPRLPRLSSPGRSLHRNSPGHCYGFASGYGRLSGRRPDHP
jgi:Sodium/glutamate symporter